MLESLPGLQPGSNSNLRPLVWLSCQPLPSSVSKVFMGQSQLLIAAFLKSAEVTTLNAPLPPGKIFTTASELVINFFQV